MSKLDETLSHKTAVDINVGDLYCHWQKIFNEFFPFPKPVLDNTRIEVIAQKEGVFSNDAVLDELEPVIINLYLKDPVSGIERKATICGITSEFIMEATEYISCSHSAIAKGDTKTIHERYEGIYFFSPYGVWKRLLESVPYRVDYENEMDYLRKKDLLGCEKSIIERELKQYNHNVELFNSFWTTLFPPGKENEFLNEIIDEINIIHNDISGELWNYDHPENSREYNQGCMTHHKALFTEKHWWEALDDKRKFPEVEEYLK